MTRRLFGFVTSCLFLCSVLACLGLGSLWARARWSNSDPVSAAVAGGGLFVWCRFEGDGVWAKTFFRWPGPNGAWVEAGSGMMWGLGVGRDCRVWAWGGDGPSVSAGTGRVDLGDDGTPFRAGSGYYPVRPAATIGPLPVIAVDSFPYWPLVAATALSPLIWTGVRVRRLQVLRRRRRLGLCADCGYDLRGFPGSGRCSECGAAVPGGGAA